MFLYPAFDKNGKQIITKLKGKTSDMLMDIDVYKMTAGQSLSVHKDGMECAALLLSGSITYYAGGIKAKAERSGVFTALPTCLHAPKGVKIRIKANADSEILVQRTPNETDFPVKLYRPADIRVFTSCDGRWENTAVRDVSTVFDYGNAPYSNMVLGEVYARQGRWWSYIPHWHPQPEVYYYKFDRDEGFGACFIGDDAYTIKDESAGLFPGGKTHVQVTAPGYPMYCCWMIRHLDGNPWKETRTDDPRYTWLLK